MKRSDATRARCCQKKGGKQVALLSREWATEIFAADTQNEALVCAITNFVRIVVAIGSHAEGDDAA